MPSINLDSNSGRYHIRFRYSGASYRRSLKTKSRTEALAAVARVGETLRLIERGRITVPDNADPALFILSDGKLESQPRRSLIRTLNDLWKVYEASLPHESKEQATIAGERIHFRHLKRHLGASRNILALEPADLQKFINRRSNDKWNGETVKGDTIAKEITTFRLVWNSLFKLGHLSRPAPVAGLVFPKRDEREPFLTWDEIEARISRGGMSDREVDALWECLYLTRDQIDEVLRHVRQSAAHSFIYPMFVFAAHTGARRSEILRSRIDDFKFDEGVVQIREKKKSREKKVTFRRVELTELLRDTMKDWFEGHPGGVTTICSTCQIPRGRQRELGSELTVGQAHTHFKQTLSGSRWEKIRGFHVFRHSFASNAAFAGVPDAVIDAWLGHQTEEMRRRYRHLFPEQRRKAIDSVFGRNGQ